MRYLVFVALLLLLIPSVVFAGNDGCGCKKASCSSCSSGSHDKCDSGCKSGGCNDNKCGSCKEKCHSGCKQKCDGGCKSGCDKPKCNSCEKPKCNSCEKPKCNSGCKSGCKDKCHGGCQQSKCNSCGQSSCSGGSSCGAASSCAKPCACQAWQDYCGCGTVSSLCISITACEGTAGPLKLQLRNPANETVVVVELPGPIEGYYNYTYTFETPVDAALLAEATLINDTEDPATLTSLRVVGMDGYCFNWVYVDHTCPGVLVGPGGCKRMVIY
jgi:hypothetical protein